MTKFDKNSIFKARRGFARLITFGDPITKRTKAEWVAPDGSTILDPKEAAAINDRRRAQLAPADAWRSLKEINPDAAKELGWNGFQKSIAGYHRTFEDGEKVGMRRAIIQKLSGVIDQETATALEDAAKSTIDETGRRITGWGDSDRRL